MNPLIQLKTTAPLLIALALLGFALSPTAQAVVPAPDGGYPGGNTAEGQNALLNLTTGGYNTAVGFLSLQSDTTGQLKHGDRRWDAGIQRRRQQHGHWLRRPFEQWNRPQQHGQWHVGSSSQYCR